jgi:hypothetical protein
METQLNGAELPAGVVVPLPKISSVDVSFLSLFTFPL